ncbi:uncharacterized protein BT62DRAFT_637845 [Guyanagaster necrorhizus]|uniref:Uncharacterized protein n=1 Tax=Guyanagaster necrorhizus TaxID=856835 RepID=A0A9P7VGG2_9AGAR|nr:uncharacterized protein BT62DRAFT_637845 [Guyanagaster necrorhizus MCA 3950]KAG7440102.1 hypothetical protein BT62DRAFT_637845 [Guyanagaster necrorhizus MCA 3950]
MTDVKFTLSLPTRAFSSCIMDGNRRQAQIFIQGSMLKHLIPAVLYNGQCPIISVCIPSLRKMFKAAAVLGFTVLPALASGPLPRKIVARELVARDDGVIPALLRTPFPRSLDGLVVRQTGTCETGYLPCSDGSGCCPVGEYCGTWGGLLGCCPNGETCVANNNQECDYVGYTLCSGEDFCCPAGDLCYRDSTGSPACSDLSSGGTSSFLISSALGTTFVSGTTKAAVTSTTVLRSSSALGFTTNVQAGTTSSPTGITRSVATTIAAAGDASSSSSSSISSAANSQTTGLSGLGRNGAGIIGVSFNIVAFAVCSTLGFTIFN